MILALVTVMAFVALAGIFGTTSAHVTLILEATGILGLAAAILHLLREAVEILRELHVPPSMRELRLERDNARLRAEIERRGGK